MKTALPVLGVIMIIIGLIFFFQGIGVLPGSAMTGVIFWSVVGVVLIGAGVGLITYGIRSRRQS